MKLIIRLTQVILVLSLIIAVFITPQAVFAYSYYGIHWNAEYEYYDMSGVPSEWQYAIMYAASAWNQAGADWLFAGWSGSSHDLTTGDDFSWVLARTYVVSSNYIISDCDTVFNTTDFTFHTNGQDYDVQSVMCHEFGHWLMLNDISDPDTIMNSYYTGNRVLDQDDKDGIIYIYGSYP